jgi:hypothetical protein
LVFAATATPDSENCEEDKKSESWEQNVIKITRRSRQTHGAEQNYENRRKTAKRRDRSSDNPNPKQ